MVRIGVIGGSGLDDPKIMKPRRKSDMQEPIVPHMGKDLEETELDTPFGAPSSVITLGVIEGVDVALLSRHGQSHTIPPTQVNYRANVWALKELGCTHILGTTAVGSLREEIRRGDFVFADQFIDFTRRRVATFHEQFLPGRAAHTAMPDPFSDKIRRAFITSARELGLPHHERGTIITIEGPRFSTRAESRMYRVWGADIVNMSIAPEAALANEAGIPYGVAAMSTDYDCWKEDETPVTWDMILEIFSNNVQKMTDLLIRTIPKLANGAP